MKTIKQLRELIKHQTGIEKTWNSGRIKALKDVIELIDELQNKASEQRKIDRDKRYWLGCCQILNELKAMIEGK